MSETTAKRESGKQAKQQNKHPSRNDFRNLAKLDCYGIDHLTQDEAIAYFPKGSIHGIWTPSGDMQSDGSGILQVQPESERFRQLLGLVKKRLKEELSKRNWETGKSVEDEDSAWSVAAEEQIGGQDIDVDTSTDDVLQWTCDQLASAIMHPEAEADMPRLREMILVAEDTGFTVDQSEQLSPWLLDFAQRYRESNDPQDKAAVWSAIRTGASMLRPHAAGCLRSLLEPGHCIETSLVTVKMIGRIFEAQPPADMDEHDDLANEVCQIAKSLLNGYAIAISQSAAMAQLAIYALAAMASRETQQIVKTVQQLDVTWFTQQTYHELRELRNIWASQPAPVAERPLDLLDSAIQSFT